MSVSSTVTGTTDAGEMWSNEDLRHEELRRALHALAYLKRLLGNERLRALVEADTATMTRRVADWVERSHGGWATRFVELVVPGPAAATFHRWYERAWAEGCEGELRAGHPEHVVSHALPGRAEVIENVGETDLPWRIFYEPLPEGKNYPVAWREGFPVRFGSQIVDGDGLCIGYTMHALRDEPHGMRMVLTTVLPAAAPAALLERHLCHFCIEFSNWASYAAMTVHAS